MANCFDWTKEDTTVCELKTSNLLRSRFPTKTTDEFSIRSFNIKILFLPVVHHEMDPIEKVLDAVKRAVSHIYYTFMVREVQGNYKSRIVKDYSSNVGAK